MLEQNKTNPEKQPVALYYFARAASYEGPNSLPASDRKNLMTYLNTAYVKYHGSDEGLANVSGGVRSRSRRRLRGFRLRVRRRSKRSGSKPSRCSIRRIRRRLSGRTSRRL